MTDESNTKGILRELFQAFFSKHWPVWVGGLILGLLNVFLFMIKSPWGGSGGYNNWGENFYQVIGFLRLENVSPIFKELANIVRKYFKYDIGSAGNNNYLNGVDKNGKN